MINDIRNYLPTHSTKIVDVFGGGFNVGINLPFETVAYNDINCFVTQLIKSFQDFDTYEYLLYIRKLTKKYGLGIGNGEAYREARAVFNALPIEKRDPRFLFTLILYGFQQQIRFNGNHGFNNPAGNRWFNDKVLEKMISFSRRIKECECIFYSRDFKELDTIIDSETFVYLDPPYRLTCGAYNDGKRGFEGWTIEHEADLFDFLDGLDSRDVPFMFSYVLENGGLTNGQIHDWQTALYNKEQISKTV